MKRIICTAPALALMAMLLLFLAPAARGADDPWLIRGGKGVGKFQIGRNIADYQLELGALEARPSSKPGMTGFYSRKTDLMFLTMKGTIVGITVFSPLYHTAAKVAVGSTKAQVRKAFGAWLELRADNVVYRQAGLAFTFERGKVAQIFVVEAEKHDPLRGDSFIVAGARAGKIRIGMPFSTVQDAWGQAEDESPAGSGTLYKFKNKGIMLMVQGGKVNGIIVYASDYETLEGVRVGTSRGGVVKCYGAKYSTAGETMEYTKKGIGFGMGDGKVVQIMIVAPHK